MLRLNLLLFVFLIVMHVNASQYDDELQKAEELYNKQIEKLVSLNATYVEIYDRMYSDYLTVKEAAGTDINMLVTRLQYCAFEQNETVPINIANGIYSCIKTTIGENIYNARIKRINSTINNAISSASDSLDYCKSRNKDATAISCFNKLTNKFNQQYKDAEKKAGAYVASTDNLRVNDQQRLTSCVARGRGTLVNRFRNSGVKIKDCL